jgi:acyl dehydratase
MPALTGTVLFNAVPPGEAKVRISGSKYASRGTAVTLDGAASSSIGSNLASHRWRQLSGPPVATSDPTLPRLTFVMPEKPNSTLRFELEVTDEDGLVDAEEIAVTGD